MDSGHFIESFPKRSMLLADLKKVTSGIGNCSLGSYCLVVKSNRCSEFRVNKRPIANNQLIRHFRIEKGTGTAQLFLESLLGTYWSAIGQFFSPVPEVFAKVNSAQFPSRFYCGEFDILKERRKMGWVSFRKGFWDRYWGRTGQLLANSFSLSPVTIPKVFAKANSPQFPYRFYSGELLK